MAVMWGGMEHLYQRRRAVPTMLEQTGGKKEKQG